MSVVDRNLKSYSALTRLLTFFGGVAGDGPMQSPLIVIPYGVAFAPDASKGNEHVVTITDGVAFAINAPTNPPAAGLSQRLSITFVNASGGAAGAGTFDAIYKMASNTLVAIATGKNRTYEFQWNGTSWIEVFQTAADIAN